MRIGAAVAVALACSVLTGCAAKPTLTPTLTPTHASSITVGGVQLLWAGTAPFSSPVVYSTAAHQLSVQIRRLPTDGPFSACGDLRFVPTVREASGSLVVDIATYAPRPKKEPNRLGCVDGLGGSSIPLVVALPGEIGDRGLVDAATGRTIRVLDASSMPSPDPELLPDGVEAEPLQWDDDTKVAWQRWLVRETAARAYQDVSLLRGPAAGIEAGAPTPGTSRTIIDLGDGSGRLWSGTTSPHVVVIRWARGRDTYEVRTVRDGDPTGQVDQALAISRSVDAHVVTG